MRKVKEGQGTKLRSLRCSPPPSHQTSYSNAGATALWAREKGPSNALHHTTGGTWVSWGTLIFTQLKHELRCKFINHMAGSVPITSTHVFSNILLKSPLVEAVSFSTWGN